MTLLLVAGPPLALGGLTLFFELLDDRPHLPTALLSAGIWTLGYAAYLNNTLRGDAAETTSSALAAGWAMLLVARTVVTWCRTNVPARAHAKPAPAHDNPFAAPAE